MLLIDQLLQLLGSWHQYFPQKRTLTMAVRQALGSLCTLGRTTISRTICFNGRDQKDWSGEYKLHSRSPWKADELFQPAIENSLPFFSDNYISVAADETKLTKTGSHIPGVSCMRDPMSPPFHTNFIYGIRFIQISALLPLYKVDPNDPVSARGVPVRFVEAPTVKKPKKNASEEQWKDYKAQKKEHNLSTHFVSTVMDVRKAYDQAGAADKTLIVAGDGSFCNRNVFDAEYDRTIILVRARKDLRLCFPASCNKSKLRWRGSKRIYGVKKFTPEKVRLDPKIPWETATIFVGGEYRTVRYKERKRVLWQRGAKRKFLRLIVLAPAPYRLTKNGRTYYRDPAYLLCQDNDAPITTLIQTYCDRWEIEVNNRDEKDIIGVGDAQVRSIKSVPRQPAFVVAAYSLLLLAGILTFGVHRTDAYLQLPKWRRKARRPSCLDLISLLRKEIGEHPEKIAHLGVNTSALVMATTAFG